MTQPVTRYVPLRGVITRSEDVVNVGDRVYVQVTLFDRALGEQATGLTPALYFSRPGRTILVAGTMTEMSPGIYQGSGITDVEGTWYAEVDVTDEGMEAIYQSDTFYVNPSLVIESTTGTGVAGPAGPAGPPGPTGAAGAQGIQGIQGVKGDTGTTGAQGIQGVAGTAGQSFTYRGAYAAGTTYALDDVVTEAGTSYISMQAANTGHDPAADASNTWWAELAIAGAQGPQGIQGVKGDAGNQGTQGIQGVKGDTGNTGAVGPAATWTQLTQAQYTALGVKDPGTLYVIVG